MALGKKKILHQGAAAELNASENFGVVAYRGNGSTQSIGDNNIRLLLSDSGGHTMTSSIRTLDSEFTQTKPTGYLEWGGDLTKFGSGSTLSNSNKTVTTNSTFYNGGYTSNNYSSGKYYAEIVQDSSSDTNDKELAIGLISGTSSLTSFGWRNTGVLYASYTGNITASNTNTISANDFVSNDVIGLAVDLDAGIVEFFKNGTTQGSIYIPEEPLNFQPDLVWIKNRDNTPDHLLYDSIRGAGFFIRSNTSDSQNASYDSTRLTSFDSNGFTVGSSTGNNTSGEDYVAWCWKAASSTTSISASGSQLASDVRANTAAGFSIVKYTGTGSNATVGHGLSNPPELIFVKTLDSVDNWMVLSTAVGSEKKAALNANVAFDDDSLPWNSTDPTSSVFSIGTKPATNASGDDFIAYCFHSVDSYQKVGSYEGDSDSGDQSITELGFQPRFLLLKNADDTGNWVIIDSTRGNDEELYANLSNVESNEPNRTTLDSDGFTVRSGRYNNNGDTFIYLAIA